MAGNTLQAMTAGIDRARVVLVFVTRAYVDKCKKEGNDNCKLEFEYAYYRKSVARLVPVVLEPGCGNPASWDGPVGAALASKLYVDMQDDGAVGRNADALVAEVRRVQAGGVARGVGAAAAPDGEGDGGESEEEDEAKHPLSSGHTVPATAQAPTGGGIAQHLLVEKMDAMAVKMDTMIAKQDEQQKLMLRVEQALLATRRLVGALALGEIDCPHYVFAVPDEPPGGWSLLHKVKFRFDDTHATQLRLVLVCAHDFKRVACGPDGKGYRIKITKGGVKEFFHTYGLAIKVGLFVARAALLASGVGLFAIPFLPHAHLADGTVDGHAMSNALDGLGQHGHQLHLMGEMLDAVGELAEEGAEAAEAHEELNHVLATNNKLQGASKKLRAWTGQSYRALATLLKKQDPELAHTGLQKVKCESSGTVEWVAPHNVDEWQRPTAIQ
jgi:hypothetical protein